MFRLSLNKKNKQILLIITILLLALSIRFYVAPSRGHSGDIKTQQSWGIESYLNGVENVYLKTNSDYPPLYHYVLKFNAFLYNRLFDSFETNTPHFNFISKLIPNLIDVLTALIIFLFLKKIINFKIAFLIMFFYVFNPGIIYNTAYWGQVDCVNTLFMLLSIIMLIYKKTNLSWLFITLAVLTKLQSIVLFPIILFITWKNKKIKGVIKGAAFGLVTILIICFPFILNNQLNNVINVYISSTSKWPYITMNAYNFWHLFNPVTNNDFRKGIIDNTELLGLVSHKLIGLILLGVYCIFILYYLHKKNNQNSILIASSAMVFAFFILPTQIHERYLFPFFALFSLIYFKNKDLKYIYIILSVTFFLNLLYVLPFHYPLLSPLSILNILKEIFYNTKIIALMNVLIFIYFISFIKQSIKNPIKQIKIFKNIRKYYFSILIFLILILTLPVYLHFLAPTIIGGDSAELALQAHKLGVVHSPGYPLYLFIGKLFTLLPLKEIGYRTNIMSAFFSSLTIILLFMLINKLIKSKFIAFLTSIIFAFTPILWSLSEITEVYTFNLFLITLTVFLLLIWREKEKNSYLYLSFLIFGLSLGTHFSNILFLPAIMYFILATNKNLLFDIKKIFYSACFFCLGISQFLWVLIRSRTSPPLGTTYIPTTLTNFYYFITLKQFGSGGGFLHTDFSFLLNNLKNYLLYLEFNFTIILVIIGLIGICALFKKNKKFFLFLLFIFLINVFTHSQIKRNWEFFNLYLPSFLIFSICIGYGIKESFIYLSNNLNKNSFKLIIALFFIFLIIRPLIVLKSDNYFQEIPATDVFSIDQSDNYFGVNLAEQLKNLDKNALVFSGWHYFTILYYYQQVYGIRPDLEIYELTSKAPRTYKDKLIIDWKPYAIENLDKKKVYLISFFSGDIDNVRKEFNIEEKASGIFLIKSKNETNI